MRTTIRMSPELARRTKEFAARHGMTFTEVIEHAVSEHLSRAPGPKPARLVKLPISKARGRTLSHEQIKAAMEQAELEYDLKKIGLSGK